MIEYFLNVCSSIYQNCVYILKNDSKDFYASKIFSLRNKIKYSTLYTYSEIR